MTLLTVDGRTGEWRTGKNLKGYGRSQQKFYWCYWVKPEETSDKITDSNVYWTVHHCNSWGIKNQLDVTCCLYFTYICSTFWANISEIKTTSDIKLVFNSSTMLEYFKYFMIILIVSANYTFVHLSDNKVFWSSLMHGTNLKISQRYFVTDLAIHV